MTVFQLNNTKGTACLACTCTCTCIYSTNLSTNLSIHVHVYTINVAGEKFVLVSWPEEGNDVSVISSLRTSEPPAIGELCQVTERNRTYSEKVHATVMCDGLFSYCTCVQLHLYSSTHTIIVYMNHAQILLF